MKKYSKRSIDIEMIKWKENVDHKPLLLRGARQVGKTSAVRKLAESFENYLEINFEQDKELVKIFEDSLEPHQICTKLSAIFATPIIAGKTLLFFDEIQNCIPAISSLRFFYEKYPTLHVIAAGSLLEFTMSEIPSYGVGRIRSIFMYPFSFDEFLAANGEELLISEKQKASSKLPLSIPIHNKLVNYLKTFLIIGGMPEVVQKYVSTKDILQCQQVLTDLLLTYTDDFAKYKKRANVSTITSVFKSIAKFSNQKFIYSKVSENLSSRQVKEALNLLSLAGIIIPITHTAANGIPLGAEINEKHRKFILFDNGIFQQLMGLDISKIILTDNLETINKGSIAESFAGMEIIKNSNSYQHNSLYYWQRQGKAGNAEIDYVLQLNNQIVPIKVKSGTKGSMQSIFYFMNLKKISTGVRFSLENFAEYQNIEVVPLYAISNLFR